MSDSDRRTFLAQTAGALAGFALIPDVVFTPPRRGRRAHKVAVIGIGRQGRAIIDELRKLDAVEIAAVCDVVPSRLNAAAELAAGAAPIADYRQLLERSDIEAVLVATPTHLHKDIVLAALAAKRHVYCEAPLAHTAADARAIADAATSAGTVFQAGLTLRSNPTYQRARSLVRSASVRDVVSLYAQNHRKTSWRFPAPDRALEQAFNWRLDPAVSIGLAGEWATHQIDVMTWLRNQAPVRVQGSGSIRLHDDGRKIADTIALQLAWADGVIMSYDATLANSYGGAFEVLHGTHAAIRLAGTHGWLFKEADAATQGWEVYATRQQFHNEEGIVLVADATKLAAQDRLKQGAGLEHPPLYYALADFIRSFAEGASVAATAAHGLQATLIGISANEAVVTRQAIDL
ncbi:MAG TPA: Gfo/Idh/MocA family oxidoreductase [Longimicrobiales bacterium]|nr:Gfo/Idh/MocA family oxidoreductase [Longimicrobiales bacterium]